MINQLREVKAAGDVTAVAVSDDGSLVAIGSETTIQISAIASGEAILRIQLTAAVTGLAITADNQLLAIAYDHPTVAVFDCETGNLIHRLDRSAMPDFLREKRQRRVAFMPKSSSLITYDDGDTMAIWNCESWTWEHLIDMRAAQSTPVIAISPTGTHLAVVCGPNARTYRGHVSMHRLHHGLQEMWNQRHESDKTVTSAAFAPDGSKLATCGAGDGIRVWSVESGEQIDHIEETKEQRFTGVLFAGDSDHLLVIASRSLEHRRLHTKNEQPTASKHLSGSIRGFSASTAGDVVATFNSKAMVDLWNVDLQHANQTDEVKR